MNFHYIGLDAMIDNIFLWDIAALRLFGRPFIDFQNSLISGLEIGITAAEDMNSQNMIPDHGTPYNFVNNGIIPQKLLFYGADISMPVLDFSVLSMKGFADFSAIQDKGSGEMAGISGLVAHLIPFKFELLFLQPEFLPSYFDVLYEDSRSSKYGDLDVLTNSSMGWSASSGISVLNNIFYFNFQYDGYFSGDILPDIGISCELSKNLFKLIGFKVTILRKNFTGFDQLIYFDAGNSLLIVTMKLYVTENLILSIDYERNFEFTASGGAQPYDYSMLSTTMRF